MTTTIIYEPIALFPTITSGGGYRQAVPESSCDDTGGQAPTKPENLAQNTTDIMQFSWT